MAITGIYKIQSKIKPERFYIGSAAKMKNRWSTHRVLLKQNKHYNRKLQNHYNKYGESDLVFIIIELCLPDFLTSREQFYIDTLNPYFNICPIAGSSRGVKRSKEYIEKLKQRSWSEETRQKLRGASIGNKGRSGRPLTEEHKEKISKTQRGENNTMYGVEPWNKGKKGVQASPNKGKTGVHSEESNKKRSEAMKIAWKKRKLKIA